MGALAQNLHGFFQGGIRVLAQIRVSVQVNLQRQAGLDKATAFASKYRWILPSCIVQTGAS